VVQFSGSTIAGVRLPPIDERFQWWPANDLHVLFAAGRSSITAAGFRCLQVHAVVEPDTIMLTRGFVPRFGK
jgi:hypothetical protein